MYNEFNANKKMQAAEIFEHIWNCKTIGWRST